MPVSYDRKNLYVSIDKEGEWEKGEATKRSYIIPFSLNSAISSSV